ncbi:MAG: hypothetical protein AB3N11_10825, partial [Arenibacterium sp.]
TASPESSSTSQQFDKSTLQDVGEIPSCGVPEFITIEPHINGEVANDIRLNIEYRAEADQNWKPVINGALQRSAGLFVQESSDGIFEVVSQLRVVMDGNPLGDPLEFGSEASPDTFEVIRIEVPPFEVAIGSLQFVPPNNASESDLSVRCALLVQVSGDERRYVLRPIDTPGGDYQIQRWTPGRSPQFFRPKARLSLSSSDETAIKITPVYQEDCEGYVFSIPFSKLSVGTFQLPAFPPPIEPELGVMIVSHDRLINRLRDNRDHGLAYSAAVKEVVNRLAREAVGAWAKVGVPSLFGTKPRALTSGPAGADLLSIDEGQLFSDMIALQGNYDLRTDLDILTASDLGRKEVTAVVFGPATDNPILCGAELRNDVQNLRASTLMTQPIFLFVINVNRQAYVSEDSSVRRCDFGLDAVLPNMAVYEIAFEGFVSNRESGRDIADIVGAIQTGEILN